MNHVFGKDRLLKKKKLLVQSPRLLFLWFIGQLEKNDNILYKTLIDMNLFTLGTFGCLLSSPKICWVRNLKDINFEVDVLGLTLQNSNFSSTIVGTMVPKSCTN